MGASCPPSNEKAERAGRSLRALAEAPSANLMKIPLLANGLVPSTNSSTNERAKLGRRRVEPAVEARILELKASGDGMLKIGRKLGILVRAWPIRRLPIRSVSVRQIDALTLGARAEVIVQVFYATARALTSWYVASAQLCAAGCGST